MSMMTPEEAEEARIALAEFDRARAAERLAAAREQLGPILDMVES